MGKYRGGLAPHRPSTTNHTNHNAPNVGKVDGPHIDVFRAAEAWCDAEKRVVCCLLVAVVWCGGDLVYM